MSLSKLMLHEKLKNYRGIFSDLTEKLCFSKNNNTGLEKKFFCVSDSKTSKTKISHSGASLKNRVDRCNILNIQSLKIY